MSGIVIKEGAYADLLLINKNPLESNSNAKEIFRMVKGGQPYT